MSGWIEGERAPILPPALQAFLKRRGAELTGLAFLIAGLGALLALVSYHPADPSFFNATDDAPQNWLGAPGAFLADPLFQAFGVAAWGLPLALFIWSFRLIAHIGDERAWSRVVLVAPAILITAVFASIHAPWDGWRFATGLGGVFGDGVLGAVLSALPVDVDTSVRPLTLILALITLISGALCLGVNWTEAKAMARYFGASLMSVLATLFVLTGRGAGEGLRRAKEKALARRNADETEEPERLAPAPAPAARSRVRREPSFSDEVTERAEPPLARDDLFDDDAVIDDGPDEARPGRKIQVTPRAPAQPASRARAAAAPRRDDFSLPELDLLQSPSSIVRREESEDALDQSARMLETVLDDYGVRGEIGAVRPGPVVTLYELEPAPGLKASRVIGLSDDIARSMSALSARVSTVPGRNVIGIELPNETREMVLLREIFASRIYSESSHTLALALGKDIGGEPVVANLAKMPHLLVAGTTGSGKSVAINTMILSLLYRLSPEECRLIMIDPKMLELSVYDGIPHLLSPVVTDPKKAVVALKWVVAEMESRYKKMSLMGVRNVDGYNARVRDALSRGENFSRTVQTGFDEDTGQPVMETEEFEPETMPYIVVIVDEMADLMMVAGKEIEACIQRLAQMARASGIHLIMATQRPSVDVITGTIKANFPTRISFQVTSKIDSRTILGEQGAEQLLGQGDMLYMAGGGRITRVHGPFVSDEEVEEVVNHLKTQGSPDYVSAVTDGGDDQEEAANIDELLGLGGDGGDDALYDQAVMIAARDRKCSTSYIQRKLSIGYNKAARIVEQMEEQGVVSPANHVGKRDVLIEER